MATEAEWRQLVRRASDVPDLIGDKVALAMVTDVVFSRQTRSPSPQDDEVIGKAVWDAAVKLGADGELDAFLMERRNSPGLVDNWDWLYRRVLADARAALDIPGLPESLPRWFAEPLLLRIRDFVKEHRFQDDTGRYFSLGRDPKAASVH
ncbi:MAG: hypothetical protein WAV54_14040 [Acidimicrobiales bacterium]